MTPIVQFDHVSKKFNLDAAKPRSFMEVVVQRRLRAEPRSFWALRDISFAIESGERVGLIGPNGSGKSTLLKLVSKVIEPTSGMITTRGRVAGLLELGTGFHPDLTGRENIYLNASILGIPRRTIAQQLDEIIDFADIGSFIDVQVRNYSSGMTVRLGFAITTALQPEVLLIDEVLAVGDAAFQRKCLTRLEDLQAQGVTLLFVSHSMDMVQRLCKRAIWIARGTVCADGDAESVAGAYLDAQAPVQAHRYVPQFGPRSPNRWGTYQAEITKVELLNNEGVCPPYFKTGETFRLRMHYVAHARIERVAFGLAIHRHDGVHVTGPNSVRSGYDLPFIEGTGFVDYIIERLPLNQGSYELTAAIYDHTITLAYDHHHRLYPFEVRAPGIVSEDGLITFPAQWQHSR